MHDTQHPSTDDAAAAIRDALPAPDTDATDRIAQLIADGAPAARAVAPHAPRRSSRRRRFGLLRPALAVGAVAVAGAVALLAPGSDPSSPELGLLELGPDVAAAEALSVAGDAAARSEWHPLRDGEYHYTATTWTNPLSNLRMTEHRWLAADGSSHVEIRQSLLEIPGTVVWVPALSCASAMGIPTYESDTYQAAGAERPSCWKQHGSLAGAFGEIVDAPPVGAHVDGVPTYGAKVEGDLEFDVTVTERPGPPPGATEFSAAGSPTSVEIGPVSEQAPARMPAATTWVQVRVGEHVTFRSADMPAVHEAIGGPPSLAAHVEVALLPTAGDAMLERLRAEVADEVGPRADGRPGPAYGTVDQAVISMATQLLGASPLSPDQRHAIFAALATIAEEKGAEVQQDADLPRGDGTATRIRFADDLPEAIGDAQAIQFETSMYLDAETAELRAISVGSTGSEPYVTTWAPVARVTTTEIPKD